uniref:Uncharacterized protein n=1 Tax=Knipowitschia caucasica TaxID=637954 RepID=A0AAV2K8W1_KNICA
MNKFLTDSHRTNSTTQCGGTRTQTRAKAAAGGVTYWRFELFQYTACRSLALDRCKFVRTRVKRLRETAAGAIIPIPEAKRAVRKRQRKPGSTRCRLVLCLLSASPSSVPLLFTTSHQDKSKKNHLLKFL